MPLCACSSMSVLCCGSAMRLSLFVLRDKDKLETEVAMGLSELVWRAPLCMMNRRMGDSESSGPLGRGRCSEKAPVSD